MGQRGIKPKLKTIVVGENPASQVYLKNIHAACLNLGIDSANYGLPSTISQAELEDSIRGLGEDMMVTGILLQLPLPKGLDDLRALKCIPPEKDVDGLHPTNLGLLFERPTKPGLLIPCTPRGVMVLLNYYRIETAGKQVVVINRSKLVGRPLTQLLLNKDATVTTCHSKTRELKEVCRRAEILVTGIGHRHEFAVDAEMIRPGAVVIDVGTSSVNGEIRGDVDFASAMNVASYVTPVPGGVGPMTTSLLLYNTVLAACAQSGVELPFNVDELTPSERA